MTENTPESTIKDKFEPLNKKRLGIKLGVLAVIIGVMYVWRPLFHYFVYGGLYSTTGVITFTIPALIAVTLFLLPPFKTDSRSESSSFKKVSIVGTLSVILLFLGIVAAIPAGWGEGASLATSTMAATDTIDELPQTNPDNPRVIPRAVADTQTRGSTSYRQYELGPSDIARAENGDLTWSYAIQPDQFMNQIKANQQGVLLTSMTSLDNPNVQVYDNQPFTHGRNMMLHRGAKWNLLEGDYFVKYYDDPIEFTHNGTAYMQYPKTGHEWRLFPFPHTVPTWEGNALVHQNGTIDHLTPEEAQNSEILDGQRLYPLYNSEKRAESLIYRNGIINQLPLAGQYIGTVVPADMPSGTGNSQPFVIDLKGEQLSYVYAMEAPGPKSNGLAEVWYFNAETGETRHYSTGNETVFGPKRAMGLIRSEDSQTGWGDNFEVVEPIFTSIDGEPYWQAKVVPTDNTAIARISFVNADNEDKSVTEFETTANVKAFMRGENYTAPPTTDRGTERRTVPAPNEPGVSYYVVVTANNGTETKRFPVSPSEEVTITSP